MDIKQQCEQYLQYKYEYYIIGESSVSDYEFDVFEQDLIKTNDKLALKVTNLVDFPSLETIKELGLNIDNIAPSYKVKRDDTDYKHSTLMLSTQKIQVNDEDNLPLHDVNLFFNRAKTPYYECGPKYDGNGLEILYSDGKLKRILTRGDKLYGKDKTKKLSILVPSTIPMKGEIEVRGEVVVNEKYWKENFSRNDPKNPDNARNWVAGIISKENYYITELNALVFVAFSMVEVKDEAPIYIENEIKQLKENGFNKNHDPFMMKIKNINDFEDMYFKYKEYREQCEFMLDGIVIKYPEYLRNSLGANNKYPKWSVAIKFIPDVVKTKILSIIWTLGKDGHLTPIAQLEPVELLGTMVRKASLANLGNIQRRGAYPGAIVSLKKSGEIIPMIIDVLVKSPDHDKYEKELNDYLLTH
jgi:DNA ligase (NAD+)